MGRLLAIVALIAIAPLGCVSATEESEGTETATASRSEALEFQSTPVVWRLPGNSLELVGRDLNGRNLNGSALDGRKLERVRIDSARFAGEAVKATIDGSELQVVDSLGRHRRAEHVIGLSLVGNVDDGSELTIRVDGVEHEKESSRDVYRYTVSYDSLEGSRPLCGVDAEGRPVRAIAMQGRWDYREGVEGGGSHLDDPASITFACEGYVIAKCVNMGYAPWRPVLACMKGSGCERTTLASVHQACTRMLRADYCGDGVSHTHDGVPVNAYDVIGIRVDSESWAIEAEWDQTGARCAVGSRLPSQPAPQCAGILDARADCGSLEHFESGTLLISEVQP